MTPGDMAGLISLAVRPAFGEQRIEPSERTAAVGDTNK
jgi:hypothetical protein